MVHVYILLAWTEIDEYWLAIHPCSLEDKKTGLLNADVWSPEFVDCMLKTGASSEVLMQAKHSTTLQLYSC